MTFTLRNFQSCFWKWAENKDKWAVSLTLMSIFLSKCIAHLYWILTETTKDSAKECFFLSTPVVTIIRNWCCQFKSQKSIVPLQKKGVKRDYMIKRAPVKPETMNNNVENTIGNMTFQFVSYIDVRRATSDLWRAIRGLSIIRIVGTKGVWKMWSHQPSFKMLLFPSTSSTGALAVDGNTLKIIKCSCSGGVTSYRCLKPPLTSPQSHFFVKRWAEVSLRWLVSWREALLRNALRCCYWQSGNHQWQLWLFENVKDIWPQCERDCREPGDKAVNGSEWSSRSRPGRRRASVSMQRVIHLQMNSTATSCLGRAERCEREPLWKQGDVAFSGHVWARQPSLDR